MDSRKLSKADLLKELEALRHRVAALEAGTPARPLAPRLDDEEYAFLRATLDAFPAHVAVLDASGTILAVNDAWERFGAAHGADMARTAVGANYLEVCRAAGVTACEIVDCLEALLRGEQRSFRQEYACHDAQQQRWFVLHATRLATKRGVRIMMAHENISPQKLAEQALHESKVRAAAILDTTVDAIITIDARGRVQSFNQAAESIFGYTAEEVLGENVHILMPSPFREAHDGYLRNYLTTGQRRIIGIGREVQGQHKDGTVFPIDLAVSEVQVGGRRLFTGIVRDLTERRRLEQDILRAAEGERRRISQELHDGLGAHLTGLGLISQSLARQMANADHPEAETVAEITTLIKEADQQARSIARVLMPVELEKGGLVTALRRLTRNAERAYHARCSVDFRGPVSVEDQLVATNLFRIAQEALTNAFKHGKASTVRIVLEADTHAQRIALHIEDNGIGLPEVLPEDRGIGLQTMHYRAHVMGASLMLRRRTEGGTRVTCVLQPVNLEHAPAA